MNMVMLVVLYVVQSSLKIMVNELSAEYGINPSVMLLNVTSQYVKPLTTIL